MSLARHTAANVVGGLAPLVVALITVPVFLHRVGSERYGVLAVLWTLLAYFTFFDFGFGRAVAQRMSKLSDDGEQARSDLLWTAMVATALLGLTGALLLWWSADFLLEHVVQLSPQGRGEAAGAIHWLIPALPVVLLTSVLRGAVQARLRFVELNAIEILTSILTQMLPLAAALMGFVSLDVLVPVTLISRLASASLLLYVAVGQVPIRRRPAFRRIDIVHLARYGGWVSVMSMTVPLLVTADRLVIAAMQGADRVPYYTIPFDLVTKAMIITTSVSGALFPRLVAAAGHDAAALARDAGDLLVSIMTPVIIAGLFSLHPFMRVWVGDSFANASFGVAEILMIGIWANAWCAAHQSLLLGRDSPHTVVLVYVLELPIYVCLLWTGLRFGGLLGAAAAWSLRAMLEGCIFVAIAGSWRAMLSRSVMPFVLVLGAVGVVLATPTDSTVHWVTGVLLLSTALISRREMFVAVFRTFKVEVTANAQLNEHRTTPPAHISTTGTETPSRIPEPHQTPPIANPYR